MVNGVLPFQNDLRNGDKGVAFLQQIFNNARQRFRGVFRCIVEQDNTPGLDFGGYSLCNFISFQILPVQAVTIPYKGKSLGHNALGLLFGNVFRIELASLPVKIEISTTLQKRKSC